MKAQISKYQERYRPVADDTSARSREELILKYAPLVRYIAERMAMRLPPSVSKDDLASAGILGLFDAIDKFDPERGVKFRTYAEHRIRGAILDELRKMDWVLRSVRRDVH
ncbi:MAG: FliA/WhiG family RNA polymerase sigma factor, partial [Deltaproteobacteria bacterium]